MMVTQLPQHADEQLLHDTLAPLAAFFQQRCNGCKVVFSAYSLGSRANEPKACMVSYGFSEEWVESLAEADLSRLPYGWTADLDKPRLYTTNEFLLWGKWKESLEQEGVDRIWIIPVKEEGDIAVGAWALHMKEGALDPDPAWFEMAACAAVSVLRDTEHRRITGDRLKLLNAAIQHMYEAVIITDNSENFADFRILFVNEAALRLTGYGRELLGLPISVFYGPRTDLLQIQRLQTAIQAGEPVQIETFHYRKDESEFLCQWTLSPIRDASGTITQWVSIQRDVTDLRRSEEELLHGRKLRAVGEMAGGFAHEFRNLLTPMLLQVEELSDALKGQENLQEALHVIQDTIAKAKDLSERILVLGRKTPAKQEWHSLSALVDENLALVTKTVDRRIDIAADISEKMPSLWVCRSSFSQILLNLIFNARDALIDRLQQPSPAGWIPRITVVLERGSYVPPASVGLGNEPVLCQRLAVQDNGPGIPASLYDRIFEPFFTTKGPSRGTGLGLSMVWNLVMSMGGWIQVQSVVGIGTRMLVFFPEQDALPPQETAMVQEKTDKDLTGARLLVVEDEPLIVRSLQVPLKRLGLEVDVAEHGRKALQLASEVPQFWQLVLSDLNMPQMDGVEFITELRNLGYGGKIAVITGYVSEEDRKRLADVGVDAVLSKPVSRQELTKCVQSLL